MIDEIKIRKNFSSLSKRIIFNIERNNLIKANRLIVVTPRLKEVINRDYSIVKDKIHVIENGANTDLFKPLDKGIAQGEIGLNKDAVYICFTGIFYRWQGIEDIIKAMPFILKTCPDAKALLVGDGEMAEQLVNLTENLGIKENVIFTGRIPYEKVPLYINASDICVVPKKILRSGYSPLKLCEYLACAKPVVATNTSGFELLREIRAGLLVNPEEPQEFAQAITGLLDDPVLRNTMGENGRKYVVSNRSWEIVAKKVAEVCENAIKYHKKSK